MSLAFDVFLGSWLDTVANVCLCICACVPVCLCVYSV